MSQAQTIETPYWERLGCHEDPFEFETETMFVPAEWDEHVELFDHLLQFSPVLKLIVGSTGIGKSSLLSYLEQKLAPTLDFIHITVDENTQTSEFISLLYQRLGLEQSLVEKPRNLDAVVEQSQENDRASAIIIDDAQLLSNELLQLIVDTNALVSPEAPKFHFILSGDEKFSKRLRALVGKSYKSIAHEVRLSPFTPEDTKQYIISRLKEAGFEGEVPLQDKAIKKIMLTSKGIPEKIHAAAKDYLQLNLSNKNAYSFILEKHRNKLIGGAMLFSILAVLFYQIGKEQPLKIIEERLKLPQDLLVEKEEHLINPLDIDLGEREIPEDDVSISSINEMDFTNDGVSDDADNLSKQNKVDVSEGKQENSPEENATNLSNNTSTDTSPSKQIPYVSEPATNNKATSRVGSGKALTVKGEEKPEPMKTTVSSRAEHTATASDEEFILNANGKYYTIQILGVSTSDSLKTFIAQHELIDKARTLKTKRNNRDWYILIYGQFPDRQSAQKALASLPKGVQNHKPWLRRNHTLKKILRKNQTS